MSKQVYVEIQIQAPLDEVWRFTQTPELHERWDLRFTNITYLPRAEGEPQQFEYATRIGFGLRVAGRGESTGTRQGDDTAASALKFWSDDPKSLIEEGSGYWKYCQGSDHVSFLTGYDYRTRFGAFGRAADLVFSPAFGLGDGLEFPMTRADSSELRCT